MSKTKQTTLNLLRRFLRGNAAFIPIAVAIYFIDTLVVILTPLFQQVYTDSIITKKNPEWFTPLMVCYFMLFFLSLISWMFINSSRKRQLSRLSATAHSRYLWTLLRLPMSFVDRLSSGELASRYGSIDKALDGIEHALPLTTLWLQPLLCGWLLTLYSRKLAAIELLAMLVLLIAIRTNAKYQKRKARSMEKTDGRLQSITMNGLNNIETIKAMGGEEDFFCTWDKAYSQSLNARIGTTTSMALMSTVPLIVLQLSNALILCLGSWFILNGELTPGMLLASQGLTNNIVFPMNKLLGASQHLMNMHSSLERIAEVTDNEPRLPAIKLPSIEELLEKSKLFGDVELRNVTFGYTHEQPPILKNFSLHVKAGQQVAFVGLSGCGKSTVAKLMSGLYEPWEGEVLFDGVLREQVNRMLFVNSVSVVNQDITLFEGTISDNIKMWDSSIEDFAMILAANAAQIHQEIAERPGAYQGMVVEGGKNLSGGQRQRIEIATALAKEPTIIIMDEATSALDLETEKRVMDHLRYMGITLIMVAHRLDTIRHCDCIYVMEHGKIVQQGTHEELMCMEGLYKELMKYA
ncbi:MAG: peptidase domain-containing ABC transporter [Bacteroidaceae bacterium]|jgi:ABC-type bacteriocin/lantibiotic exporter with double-glycine peptidase domain|nr:peptidase domain-containing ABC transporter [Bacteroidaceae bacterium]